MQTNKLKKNY